MRQNLYFFAISFIFLPFHGMINLHAVDLCALCAHSSAG